MSVQLNPLSYTQATDSQNTMNEHLVANSINPNLESIQATATIANQLFASPLQALSHDHDYHSIQKKLSAFLAPDYVNPTFTQWQSFCQHLNSQEIPSSEKLLLLQAVSQCMHNPLDQGELAQLLTLVTHLKSISGVRLFKTLFSAQVPHQERHIRHYITVCQLLVELHEQPSLFKCMKENLPYLTKLISVLQEMEAGFLTAKYPERDIEETISRFSQLDEIIQFPLSAEELVKIKAEYLEVKARIHILKKSPAVDVKETVKRCALEWRDQHDLSAKHQLIAILAENIRHIYKIAPYDTQILSFLALVNTPEKLKGRIAQIKTGEGKSTMIAMLTAFMACQNQFVDVVTSSSYLAIRDCKKYTPFYQTLGLSVSHICERQPKQSHFHGQILYGTNTDFEFALLRDGLSHAELRHSMLNGKLQPRTFDVVIIDEVDNLFLDTALNSALLSVPGHEDWSWIYEPILTFIKDPLNQIGVLLLPKESIRALRQYLMTLLAEKYHEQILNLSVHCLRKWLSSAQNVLFKKLEKRDYIVKPVRKHSEENTCSSHEIVILDYMNTGRLNEGSQWRDGVHQFLQAKHKLKITPESLTAASLAHPTYFGLYKCIMGLTGTMGEAVEREEIQKIYGVDSFDVPPHFPNQRKKTPSSILPDSKIQHETILHEIEEMQKQGRPVLVLFQSVEESDAFSQNLSLKGIKHQLLNETQREDEDYLVARAGDAGMITIATNTAGRGTDILLSPQSKEAGGLYVVFAFFPINLRVEGQGFGRAARQGQPGSACMILNAKDENIQSLINGHVEGTEEALFSLLYQLRTEKIKQESHRRYLCSQMEMIYFDKLQLFFRELKEVHQLFKEPSFKEKFIDKCRKHPPLEQAHLDVLQKNEHWEPFKEMFYALLEKRMAGVVIDWGGLFDLFQRTYLSHVQKQWALFYNKLHDEMDLDDISAVQKHVDALYIQVRSELDNYLLNPRDNAMNILNWSNYNVPK